MPKASRDNLVKGFVKRNPPPDSRRGPLRSGDVDPKEQYARRMRIQNRNLPYGAKPKSVSRYGVPQFSSHGQRNPYRARWRRT